MIQKTRLTLESVFDKVRDMTAKQTDKPIDRAWYPSQREEVIAALYLIAGMTAWQAGSHSLAWICCVKAAADTVCAIKLAIKEIREQA